MWPRQFAFRIFASVVAAVVATILVQLAGVKPQAVSAALDSLLPASLSLCGILIASLTILVTVTRRTRAAGERDPFQQTLKTYKITIVYTLCITITVQLCQLIDITTKIALPVSVLLILVVLFNLVSILLGLVRATIEAMEDIT